MQAKCWPCVGLWLLLCQGGFFGCEAYRSSTYRYSGTTGSNTQNGASTYNYQRQTVGPPNAMYNATIYCGLFSISYDTSCKFGSIDAYVTSESAVCNENQQINCTRQSGYASMSCSGFVCSKSWNYDTFLDSVCLLLQPTDPMLPATCNVQIRGQYVAPIFAEIAKTLGIALWKAVLIAIFGFIGVAIFVFLLLACCGGTVTTTTITRVISTRMASFRLNTVAASQPYVVQLTAAEQAEQEMQAKQNFGAEQQQKMQYPGQGSQFSTLPDGQTLYAGPQIGTGVGLRDPRLDPPYLQGPYQPAFMPTSDVAMGTPVHPPADQHQLEVQLLELQQQEQQLHMQVQLQQLHLQEQLLHQQEEALKQQMGQNHNAPPAHSSTPADVYQPPEATVSPAALPPATLNSTTQPADDHDARQ